MEGRGVELGVGPAGRALAGALLLAAALLFGLAMRPLGLSLQREALADEPGAASLDELQGQLGSGLSFAILGGYRSVAANFVWLGMYGAWERRDFDKTLAAIRIAAAIDPRKRLFWIDGARILANDMPAWRVGVWETERLNRDPEGRRIGERFAREALAFLDRGIAQLGPDPLLLMEKAIIAWRKLEDLERAARLFGEAYRQPGAPYVAGRMKAEMLVRAGRKAEALAYLKKIYSKLPDDDPRAMKPVVKERLRRLEAAVAEESAGRTTEG